MRTDLFEFELPEDNTVQISSSQREGKFAGTGQALRCALMLAFLALPSSIEAQEKRAAPEPRRIGFGQVDSWAYQLQNLKPSTIPKDAFDVLVVDFSRDGSDAGALDALDVITLRKRPNKLDRIVLSYLSIGEAEDYRSYWKGNWLEPRESKVVDAKRSVPPTGDTPTPIPGKSGPSSPKLEKSAGVPDPTIPLARLSADAPPWLAEENPEWRGNYLVRYWEPGWQSIIFGSPAAYLDKIIAAGFDGIYLDKIDSNDDWQKRNRPGAEREMVDFVKRLAAYARAKRPGFLIVPQNGDELLLHRDYLETIDAIAKEDLLFGGDSRKDGEPNPEKEIAASARRLSLARRAGKPVLAVDYITDMTKVRAATRRYRAWGFVPFFAERELKGAPEDILARVDALEGTPIVATQVRPAKGRKR